MSVENSSLALYKYLPHYLLYLIKYCLKIYGKNSPQNGGGGGRVQSFAITITQRPNKRSNSQQKNKHDNRKQNELNINMIFQMLPMYEHQNIVANTLKKKTNKLTCEAKYIFF